MSVKRSLGLACLAASLSAVAAAPAFAGDGRLEINQACVAAGCVAGDAPGFPITLSGINGSPAAGRNVLSGNTTAAQIGVDVDPAD